MKVRFSTSILLLSWLSLTSCSYFAASTDKKPKTDDALASEVNRLHLDISYANDIARHEPNMPSLEGPIPYEYGSDSHHKTYRFANLKAFRIDIKRRIDSLRIAGQVVSYDTIVTGRGPIGKMSVK